MYSRAEQEHAASEAHPSHDELHEPQPGETIGTVFYRSRLPSTWYSEDDRAEMDRTGSKGTYVFTPPEHISRILDVIVAMRLPAVEVAPEFVDEIRVAWTPNSGAAFVEEAVPVIENSEMYPINRHWIYVHSQFTWTAETVDEMEECIGNTPELTEFGTSLPSREVGAFQPFFFTHYDDGFNNNLRPTIKWRYQVLTRVEDMLRVQRLVDGKWVPQEHFDKRWLKSTCDMLLPAPTMTAIVTFNSKKEMNAFKCDATISQWYLDMYEISSVNPAKELFVPNRFENMSEMCTGMFVVAENYLARRFKYYLNYSDNPHDHRMGRSPLRSDTIKFATQRRLADNPDENVAHRLVMKRHYDALPRVPGIRPIPLCHKPFRDHETGVALAKLNGSIVTELQSVNHLPENERSNFIVRIFCLAQKKILYERTGSGPDAPHIPTIYTAPVKSG